MKLFDAYAAIAFLRNEPAASRIAELLEDRREQSCITAVNLAEVFDQLVRVLRIEWERAYEQVLLVRLGGLDVLFVDDIVAEQAGRMRAQHYHRVDGDLSMADCVALATAQREQARLVTRDAALLRAARAESVDVVAL